jgi:hypothetical protein
MVTSRQIEQDTVQLLEQHARDLATRLIPTSRGDAAPMDVSRPAFFVCRDMLVCLLVRVFFVTGVLERA